jgi:hypothetical protein
MEELLVWLPTREYLIYLCCCLSSTFLSFVCQQPLYFFGVATSDFDLKCFLTQIRENSMVLYTNEAIFMLNIKNREIQSTTSFSLVFASFFLSKKELLVIEMPWKDFYQELPDVIYKPRFAT